MSSALKFYDFTQYAPTYETRADYVPEVITALLAVAGVSAGDLACDIGAGSAHMTLPLLERGLTVDAVEPTAAMRAIGERRTAGHPKVSWYEGVGEDTGRPAGRYALVTFGSSFDLTDRPRALREVARILRPGGSFGCAWNHRDLEDPLQAKVEDLIRQYIPEYKYGVRRADQTEVIEESGLFHTPVHLSGRTVFRLDANVWSDTWSSHSTLTRQSEGRAAEIVEAIRTLVRDEAGDWIDVPYVTRIWTAKKREG